MHALDNVIWNALTTSQAHFSEGRELARKFPAEVTSLGALLAPTHEAYDSLAGLLRNEWRLACFSKLSSTST